MVQIRYIGGHRPKGMVIDMDMDRVREAIKSGEFEIVDTVDKPVKKEKIVPIKSIRKVNSK